MNRPSKREPLKINFIQVTGSTNFYHSDVIYHDCNDIHDINS